MAFNQFEVNLGLLLSVVKSIASREAQVAAWLKGEPGSDSLIELYCNFYDDAWFEDFFVQYRNRFSTEQQQKLMAMDAALAALKQRYPELLDEDEALDEPLWIGVRTIAGEVLQVFEESKDLELPFK